MMELLFNDNAAWFAVPALVGTILFLIRIVMLMVGGGHVGDFHAGDVHVGGDHHGDSGEAFKALSLQSIIAFAMGFGWAALGAYRGSGGKLDLLPSAAVGIAGGALMIWVLGMMLKAMYDLQSSGNIDIRSAVGQEGEVYLTVPCRGEGRGQVRVTLQARQRIWNAITEGEALPTSTRIRVTRVNDDNTLTVSQA